MTRPAGAAALVEVVPNFSEGRDPDFVAEVREVLAASGCRVLHATMDPDHHRSVVTAIGSPRDVERGSVAAARLAARRLDLRGHCGVHPRTGVLDVLPFVPLAGIGMDETVRLARRAGDAIEALGVPVVYYARASRPPGRGLASIRRQAARGSSRGSDGSAAGGAGEAEWRAHPTAGATCVGARPVLLAWNVDVEGVSLAAARTVAGGLREAGGGFRGLRALAFRLPRQRRLQISMNLEDPSATDPWDVFAALASQVEARGGRVLDTEVIGMLPDQLADPRSGPPGCACATGRRSGS